MNYFISVLFFVVSLCHGQIYMHQYFFHGRPGDGFLPKPPGDVIERASKDADIQTHWFTQKLDHFNSGNNQMAVSTWRQLYMTNSKYYRPGGPMFVMIGGEGDISPGWMDYGDWVKNAKIYGAFLFQLEHRYYGQSHPTSDISLNNLQWLSSRQALADLAHFITTMKYLMGMQNHKVIVFGGSYAGNLAAWFKLKYPHIADGAVASSAPVWAKADFYEYLEVVGAALDYVSPGCSYTVQQAFNILTSAVSTNPGSLTHLLGLCSPVNFTNSNDLTSFYEIMMGPFEAAAQYNTPGTNNIVLPNGSLDPWHALGILSSRGPTEIAEYYTGGSHCYDMNPARQNDSPQLTAVRAAITQQIGKFLAA